MLKPACFADSLILTVKNKSSSTARIFFGSGIGIRIFETGNGRVNPDVTMQAMTEVRNPFADPLRFERRVPECAIVIFGAAGDLAKRKLLPALYRLAYDRRLPASFAIIGNSRTPMSDDDYRQRMHEAVKQFSEDSELDEELWKRFAANLYYVAGDVKDPALYVALREKVTATGQANVLF